MSRTLSICTVCRTHVQEKHPRRLCTQCRKLIHLSCEFPGPFDVAAVAKCPPDWECSVCSVKLQPWDGLSNWANDGDTARLLDRELDARALHLCSRDATQCIDHESGVRPDKAGAGYSRGVWYRPTVAAPDGRHRTKRKPARGTSEGDVAAAPQVPSDGPWRRVHCDDAMSFLRRLLRGETKVDQESTPLTDRRHASAAPADRESAPGLATQDELFDAQQCDANDDGVGAAAVPVPIYSPPAQINSCTSDLSRQSVDNSVLLPRGVSVFTSLPDCSEVSFLTFPQWEDWFSLAAELCCRALHPDAVAIFYQTDIKREGTWVDKGFLVTRGARRIPGVTLLWHKIVCRSPPGHVTFGRPGYAHLMCFGKSMRLSLEDSTTDLIPRLGAMPWTKATGVEPARMAVAFMRKMLPHCVTVFDPFCGRGTILAVANDVGLNAVGVEIDAKRAKAAMVFRLEEVDGCGPSDAAPGHDA